MAEKFTREAKRRMHEGFHILLWTMKRDCQNMKKYEEFRRRLARAEEELYEIDNTEQVRP